MSGCEKHKERERERERERKKRCQDEWYDEYETRIEYDHAKVVGCAPNQPVEGGGGGGEERRKRICSPPPTKQSQNPTKTRETNRITARQGWPQKKKKKERRWTDFPIPLMWHCTARITCPFWPCFSSRFSLVNAAATKLTPSAGHNPRPAGCMVWWSEQGTWVVGGANFGGGGRFRAVFWISPTPPKPPPHPPTHPFPPTIQDDNASRAMPLITICGLPCAGKTTFAQG